MRVNFGLLLKKGQKKPTELVAKVSISRKDGPSISCSECGRRGAGEQEVTLVSLRTDLDKEIGPQSPIFKLAEKVLKKELRGPVCKDHADRESDDLSL
jgi:hypothetical protein